MNHNDYKNTYFLLARKLEDISRLGGVIGVLHWDLEVMMPAGAADARAMQMSSMAGALHEKSTDSEIGKLLNQLLKAGPEPFTDVEWCNIRESKRDYDIDTKVPRELVQEIAELGSRGHHVWAKARQENRYQDFAPVLERFIQLKIKWAEHVYPDREPYDANIDIYERGTSMAQITPVFEHLKAELIPLIKAIVDKGWHPDTGFLEGEFPIEKQEALGRTISEDMGFSFEHGRMDVSIHPFCGGGHPSDVRITTRYRTDNFIESLYAVIHETGHGLYEQGRMVEGRDLPASESLTMGIHESQSLFWERMIAQSSSFCERYLQTIAEIFPENFANVTADHLYRASNVSKPSFIRVEADEVTYPLHVILRFEIEKGLFDGSYSVSNLPDIWNEKMEDYLGICPPPGILGVLQDVHWSGGSFGYFPSYTLGAMYACQFFNALEKELPDIRKSVEEGNLDPARLWLNKNIHQKGRLYTPDELVRRVTGEPLNPDHFIKYLKYKYGGIYNL